ncbi:MAG: hypothetical protein M0D53_08935 [Flavobacterium sp. JAD_PAG50586_2]|nr:MAG: hypothetical protein M0D53_08935 [Flavobacterium sp. JAD_PAG50586_2]
MYLFLDRDNPIFAEIRSIDNQFVISSKEKPILNGKYKVEIDTLRIKLSGIDSYNIRAILKSKDVTIYMNKIE